MSRLAVCILLLTAVAACTQPGPPLLVSNAVVIAPLPGRSNTVAYMTLINQSREPIVLQKFSSPQFASIEIHETVIEDGVARMQQRDSITVEANSSAEFVAGGKHLMLIEPLAGLIPGKPITIEIHYDDGGLLLVDIRLKSRLQAGGQSR
jgi:copper(I)-binding protein